MFSSSSAGAVQLRPLSTIFYTRSGGGVITDERTCGSLNSLLVMVKEMNCCQCRIVGQGDGSG